MDTPGAPTGRMCLASVTPAGQSALRMPNTVALTALLLEYAVLAELRTPPGQPRLGARCSGSAATGTLPGR